MTEKPATANLPTERPRTIHEVMTPSPHGIESDLPLSTAHERMRNLGVRHLLVQTRGRLVGVITEADTLTGLSSEHGKTATQKLMVGDAMVPDTYLVTPSTPLAEVARNMADRRLDWAVVVDEEGDPVGIFTSNDACRTLAEILIREK